MLACGGWGYPAGYPSIYLSLFLYICLCVCMCVLLSLSIHLCMSLNVFVKACMPSAGLIFFLIYILTLPLDQSFLSTSFYCILFAFSVYPPLLSFLTCQFSPLSFPFFIFSHSSPSLFLPSFSSWFSITESSLWSLQIINQRNNLLHPLDGVLKGDLKGVKGDLKQPFDKAAKVYDAKFAKIEKDKKAQVSCINRKMFLSNNFGVKESVLCRWNM